MRTIILKAMLHSFGWTLAHAPRWLPRALTAGTAFLIYTTLPRKRRILLANLAHAFPGYSRKELVATARESVRQMVEFALLAGAQPFMTPHTLREVYRMNPASIPSLQDLLEDEQTPGLILIPHLGPQEALVNLPALLPIRNPRPINVIYRPLKNTVIDDWIRRHRERFGLRLISRKTGLPEILKNLRQGGKIGLLFDQSTGDERGGLFTFFDRVCSGTPLVGKFSEKFGTRNYFLYARRIGFWQCELTGHPFPASIRGADLLLECHRWLENTLREDPALRPSWLWMHDRWKSQRNPPFLLRLRAQVNWLERQSAACGRSQIPRKRLFLLRLPTDETSFRALIPHLQRLRTSRPDVRTLAIGKPDLLRRGLAAGWWDEGFPDRAHGSTARDFKALRWRFPEAALVFSHHPAGDREIAWARPLLSIGISSPDNPRRRLTHPWHPPAKSHPETDPWAYFLAAHGLPMEATESPRREDAGS